MVASAPDGSYDDNVDDHAFSRRERLAVYRVIAERLSISEGTVKIHLHNVYEKLGIDGRLELMLYAQEKGLV